MSGLAPDYSGATLGDITAARAALEIAERKAREREQAERQRAAEEAERAADAAFHDEIDALVSPHMGPVTAAKQALAEAQERAKAARTAAEVGEQAVTDARRILPELVERAVIGVAVSAEDVAEAHAAVTRAEQNAAFLGVVASRYAALVRPAEAALKAAIGEAHRPVFERGVDLRIEAARMADVARTKVVDVGRNPAVLAPARQVFDHANKLLHYAVGKGFAIYGGVSAIWPTRERAERRTWNRPAPGGEV